MGLATIRLWSYEECERAYEATRRGSVRPPIAARSAPTKASPPDPVSKLVSRGLDFSVLRGIRLRHNSFRGAATTTQRRTT